MFVGKVAAICIGLWFWDLVSSSYRGEHDAQIALVAVLLFAVLLSVAFWGYWGDDR